MNAAPLSGASLNWIGTMIRSLLLTVLGCGLVLTFWIACPGCGAIAGNLAKAMPAREVPASYKRFKGQSVAVMVWADAPIRTDWPRLQFDVTSAVLDKFKQAVAAKVPDYEGTRFPIHAPAMVRYQEDHPEIEAQSIAEVAIKLGVGRLVYIEINGFQTRSNLSADLFRGSALGSVKVLEIIGGKAKVAFEEGDIKSVFPPKSPEEGLPASNDDKIYAGTVDSFTTDVATRFVPHPEPEE